jgi:hypothetical protein
MNDQLNGRAVWHRSDDPYQDLSNLADAITQSTQIFNHNGALVWLKEDGKLVPIARDALHQIAAKHVVTQHLVNTNENWSCIYSPVQLTETIIRALLTPPQTDRAIIPTVPKGSSLLARAQKA